VSVSGLDEVQSTYVQAIDHVRARHSLG
jgi:hypothetical protein